MATTQIDINDPLAISVFAKELNTEILKALPITPLMGKVKIASSKLRMNQEKQRVIQSQWITSFSQSRVTGSFKVA
ncbi:hypothetical protein BscR1v2_006500 [Bartonella schoenbuchensis R1]|uniref:Uncharacterized protein n=1 Tax=Bartonella schoenbuchensis (strain DSM 13525 / NCTC 13165 / R1) TaxID=687861 RepID=A0A1S6XPM5_BARSR|nr:hypothetical protein BscR1v2_006500 [Bartonella schoenbuchensis R1]